ncbi:perlucin-like isoform X2 [Saccostrea cucullata]|uniref:perlucin-like isoform X2 n=1 Tax=Saccostrea cuccullata TaxID=36930 RepID=UPI002ED1D4E7
MLKGGGDWITLVTAQPPSCPHGWILRGSSCYLFVNDDSEDWMVAMSFCNTLQAKLVEIESVAEDEFIRMHLIDNKLTGSYWIGLSDIQAEGEWVWTTSQKTPTYSNWYPGQPDNAVHREDCANIYAHFGLHWNDSVCNSPQHFICEKDSSGSIEVIG